MVKVHEYVRVQVVWCSAISRACHLQLYDRARSYEGRGGACPSVLLLP